MNLEIEPIEVFNLAEIYNTVFPVLVEINQPWLILGAVTGVGRTTVGKILQDLLPPETALMRHFTTRNPRSLDEDERLRFGSTDDFLQSIVMNDVLFYINWLANNELYAILKSEMSRMYNSPLVLFEGTHFCWPIKSQQPDLIKNIWLVNSQPDVIGQRLKERGTEQEDERQRRISLAVVDQQFILENAQQLKAENKIDGVVDTFGLSPHEVAQEVMQLF